MCMTNIKAYGHEYDTVDPRPAQTGVPCRALDFPCVSLDINSASPVRHQ